MKNSLCENCGHIYGKHRKREVPLLSHRYITECHVISEDGNRCKCPEFKEMEIIKRQIKRGSYGNKQLVVGTVMRFTKNPEERKAWIEFMAEEYDNEKQQRKNATITYYKKHPREQQRHKELSRIRLNTAQWRKRVSEKPSIAFDILEKLITAQ